MLNVSQETAFRNTEMVKSLTIAQRKTVIVARVDSLILASLTYFLQMKISQSMHNMKITVDLVPFEH